MMNVPVSAGEVIDKITILRIKKKMISDVERRSNVEKELDILEHAIIAHVDIAVDDIAALVADLHGVNQKLWQIEDDIRDCERDQRFDDRFVQLARSVYFTNDERARIKRKINQLLGSGLIEEKSYRDYAAADA
jgi:Family of unknown function (DUF6165)